MTCCCSGLLYVLKLWMAVKSAESVAITPPSEMQARALLTHCSSDGRVAVSQDQLLMVKHSQGVLKLSVRCVRYAWPDRSPTGASR